MKHTEQWSIFPEQVDGPVTQPGEINLDLFQHRQWPGVFWAEYYYHHLNFPDGTMITVLVSFSPNDVTVIFVLGKPGANAFREFQFTRYNRVVFDEKGFGFSIGPSRFRLEGRRYSIDLKLEEVKAKITYDILGPGYGYGDGMVRYPDGKSFSCYYLPIPWARAHVEAVIEGREIRLDGYGTLNHDSQVLNPIHTPLRWRVFWFFGKDHALAVTEFTSHKEFGEELIQRLVFTDPEGGLFTSTRFPLEWDDWAYEKTIPFRFRYPQHYQLSAEGGGAQLEVEVRLGEMILKEDLYSNLPTAFRIIAKRITGNGWVYDWWGDYTIVHNHKGRSQSYQGCGVVRWMALEEKSKA